MATRKSEQSPSSDALTAYRDKRDRRTTTEPFEPERPVRAEQQTWAGRFVIHQHAATRMHWDVRLQIGPSLLSFAVPKGVSLDPAEKRLAVHTENHPLSYLDFEDVIPEGNYGAGAMIIWDTGSVRYLETSAEQAIVRGKIDFVLSGFKVQGRFGLILTHKSKLKLPGQVSPLAEPRNHEWLLVKKPDVHADPARDLITLLPRSVMSGLTVAELKSPAGFRAAALALADERGARRFDPARSPAGNAPPMVCALEGAPLSSPDWLYELKLDGVRIIAQKNGESVRLRYRSGLVCTTNYAEIARAVLALPFEQLTLDGEIVTFDERGRPNFGLLAPRIAARKAGDVARARNDVPVAFLCFDLLSLEDRDLRALPLMARKEILARTVRGNGYLSALDHIVERGDALWALCEREELEGVVAKRLTSTYQHGPQAGGHWVKLKRAREEEFVVVGRTDGKGNRKSLGALAVASFSGPDLVYRGRVGSGFTDALLELFSARLAELETSEPAIIQVPKLELKGLRWVRPELVVRIKFSGFTNEGHLRAPVLMGLSEYKRPRDCTVAPTEEKLQIEVGAKTSGEEAPAGKVQRAVVTQLGTSRSASLVLTNKGKIFWPDEGYTKGDLLDYYSRVSSVMLPFLRGRPVVLVRYPDGINGKNFYQWRAPEGTPSWLRTQELYDEEKQEARGTGKSTFLIDDEDSLLYVVNLGCIPLHVLGSREQTPGHCDFLTIDLDLGPRPFREAVLLALSLHEILDDLGLSGFPKTSGQRGLHVLVPLGPGQSFDAAKLLCELLGRLLVGKHPQVCTMERRKDKRGNKVYVDTGQTGRARTIVAPYSARAFVGATVSTPLEWKEIHLALDPSVFTIQSVPERVAEQADPLAGLLEERPNLRVAVEKLALWTQRLPG